MINKEIKKKKLNEWFPNPKPTLKYSNNFELLVAVALSARAKDESVNKVTPHLFSKYPTPFELSKANVNDVENIIRSIGFYSQKAANIIETSKILVSKYKGVVPGSREELETLPGVGPKTAGVILAQGFGKNEFPVDTHIAWSAIKLGIAKPLDSVNVIEKKLKEYFKGEDFIKLHLQLIFFGRKYCTKRTKDCKVFFLNK